VFIKLARAGTALSMAIALGVSWKLYGQLPVLQIAYPALNQLHDKLHEEIQEGGLQIAQVLIPI